MKRNCSLTKYLCKSAKIITTNFFKCPKTKANHHLRHVLTWRATARAQRSDIPSGMILIDQSNNFPGWIHIFLGAFLLSWSQHLKWINIRLGVFHKFHPSPVQYAKTKYDLNKSTQMYFPCTTSHFDFTILVQWTNTFQSVAKDKQFTVFFFSLSYFLAPS